MNPNFCPDKHDQNVVSSLFAGFSTATSFSCFFSGNSVWPRLLLLGDTSGSVILLDLNTGAQLTHPSRCFTCLHKSNQVNVSKVLLAQPFLLLDIHAWRAAKACAHVLHIYNYIYIYYIYMLLQCYQHQLSNPSGTAWHGARARL